uniref:ATP synthase subunit a n=1 Tax=Obrimoposthia wandeli TaxID=2136291 RepID=A0A7D5XZE4_9PLAT|nr:ATP synthase F0 subunit 6 [Obrimoposthia wandeli]QLJ92319.1 ATP synthase F0 subunit 6 [Obrimoposthia wandeli]
MFDYNSCVLFFSSLFVSWFVVFFLVLFLLSSLFYFQPLNFFINFCSKVFSNYPLQNGLFFFIFVSFFLLLVSNIFGLIPFSFSVTSHILFNILVGVFFWGLILAYSLVVDFNNLVGHFTPMGSPFALVNFLNYIEVISVFIRPVTLALRLTVNIAAGHVFLSLISVGVFFMSSSLVFIFLIFYYLFELAVGFLQAIVFSMLVDQYVN